MTSCGCFECIMMILPLCNGFMVVSREDPSMTPAGMTFSTLAGMAGGGLQTPGVLGIGKYFIISKKFIRADGGLPRIVWMSSFLKETMAEELKEAAIRAGDPDLIDKIADELFEWLDGPVRRVGGMNTFVAYHPDLESAILPQVDDLVDTIRDLAEY